MVIEIGKECHGNKGEEGLGRMELPGKASQRGFCWQPLNFDCRWMVVKFSVTLGTQAF